MMRERFMTSSQRPGPRRWLLESSRLLDSLPVISGCSGRGGRAQRAALLLLLAGTAACSAPPERVLRVLVRTPFADLQPGPAGGVFGGIVIANSCDSLVAFDSELRMVPALATSWSTPSDTTWRFELRRGVSFHDGRRLTAADVKHTLESAMALPGYWQTSRVPQIEHVRAPSEHLVEVETAGRVPLLLNMLAGVCVVPAGSEIRASAPLVGTGPYRLRSLDAAREAVFERFDGHWRGRASWPRAVFKFEPDGRARLARLVAGEVDLVEAPPADGLSALAGDPRVHLLERPGVQVVVLNLNLASGPFADPGARRALALCLDRRAMARDAFGGRATPIAQLAPHGVFGFEIGRTVPEPDPHAARVALKRGGSAGLTAQLLYTERDRRIAELVAAQVAVAGLRLDLAEVPWAELDRRLQARAAPAAVYILTFPHLDATDALFDLHTRSADGRYGLFNFSGLSDRELDRALTASEKELDPQVRLAHVRRAMGLALDSHALIPLVVPKDLMAARPGLTWQGDGVGRLRIADVRER
jgi:peptide/nickel transport system substrate-binding protein